MKREAVAILGIVLLAALLRLWAIGELPPGLYHDEAAEGIDALRILQQGDRPVFLPSNNGREPGFAYAVALAYAFIGPGALGLRLAASLLGVLTIPATYLWSREAFGPRVGLMTGLLLALSPWHIHLSRVGLRPVILPLFEALAFYLLWRAIRRREGIYMWLLAGAVLGITLYTYMPARLLLPLALLPATACFLNRRWSWRERAGGPLLLAVGVLIIAAPLGTYFWQHPEDFVERAQQVSVMNAIRAGADPAEEFGRNLRAIAGMFSISGDTNPRHNLPGKPIFDPFLSAAALMGLAVAVTRLRRLEYATLLLWLLIALGPAIISDSAPHFLRAAGLLPALLALPALGIVWVWERGTLSRSAFRYVVPGVAILGIVWGGVIATRDYFILWPPLAGPAFQTDRAALLRYANSRPASERLYYATREPEDPVVALVAQHPLESFHPDSLPLVNTSESASYLVPTCEESAVSEIQRLFPAAGLSSLPASASAIILSVSSNPVLPVSAPHALFRDELEIAGFTLSSRAETGQELGLTIYWRVLQAPREDYSLFVHLVGPDGEVWRQTAEPLGLGVRGASRWRPGEVVAEQRRIRIPADGVPGEYKVVIGLELPLGRRRLEAKAPDGANLGDQVILGDLAVRKAPGQPNLALLPIKTRQVVAYEAPLRLLGYNQGVERLRSGDILLVTLFWQSMGPMEIDYQMRLRLVDSAGQAVAWQAGPPASGRFPTTNWPEGSVIRDYRRLLIPAAVASGRYLLQLEIVDGGGVTLGGPTNLGSVEVQERPRQFALPEMQHSLRVDFGGSIRLLGYDIEPATAQAGSSLKITLHWQGVAQADTSYKVFVHLLDGDERIVAQDDSLPRAGQAPVTSWMRDEVVSDSHELALPPGVPAGRYRLEMGLYDPASGARVPVLASGEAAASVDAIARRVWLKEVDLVQ